MTTTTSTTMDGVIRSVSPAFLAVIDRPVEDLAATNLADVVHPDDRQTVRELLAAAAVGGPTTTKTLRLYSGRDSWVIQAATVTLTAEGAPLFSFVPPPVGTPNLSSEPPTTPASVLTRARTWLDSSGLSRSQFVAVCAVVLGAFVLRTWDLSTLPTGFHGDEGLTGLEAERILREGSIGVYTGSGLGQPTAPFYLDAITVGLFGNTIWATRILSAIAGTLTVYMTYRLVRNRFDHRTAIACAIALATMTWSIHYSRIAFGVAWWPLAVLLAVGAIDRAAREQSRSSWFIAGGMSVFGIYVYNSHWSFGLAAIGFVTIWLGVRLLQRKSVAWTALGFGGLGALVIGLPMIQFIVEEDSFLFHFDLLNRRNSPDWIEAGLGERIGKYIGWYFDAWRQLLARPLFDGADGSGINRTVPLTFGLTALIGVASIVRRHRNTFTGIIAATLVVLPMTTVLTENAVPRRNYGLSPLLAILVGFGAIALIDLVRENTKSTKRTRLTAAALVAVALFTGVVPYFTAFRNSAQQRWVFGDELTIAVEAIETVEGDGETYVNWLSPRQDFMHPSIDFLLDDTAGESRAPLGVPFQAGLDLTLAEVAPTRHQVFVLIGPYADELERLRAIHPTGQLIDQRDDPRIAIYQVPAS